MKTKLLTTAGLLALSFSFGASAAVDTIDSTDGQAGTYFTPDDASKLSSPYYRRQGQDWSWTHNAIAGSITSATLNISAYDVDEGYSSFTPEIDIIQGWSIQDSAWVTIGELAGANNIWSYTSFSLDSSWFDEIAAGLMVQMLIDETSQGWAVSLAKSVLETNGGTLPPPTPGVSEVPIPAAAFLFGPALLGFMGLRRKAKQA